MTSRRQDAAARSRIMSRIRSRDTGPELALRRALWAMGLRYRLQCRVLGSRPDLVLRAARVAVFVDGCFWHGCPEHYVAPKGSRAFWRVKLRKNVDRDRRCTAALEREGWRVVRLWEHEVEVDADAAAQQVVVVVGEAAHGRPWRPPSSMRVAEVCPHDATGSLESRHLVPLRGEGSEVEVRRRCTDKWDRSQAFAERRRGAKKRGRKSSARRMPS